MTLQLFAITFNELWLSQDGVLFSHQTLNLAVILDSDGSAMKFKNPENQLHPSCSSSKSCENCCMCTELMAAKTSQNNDFGISFEKLPTFIWLLGMAWDTQVFPAANVYSKNDLHK